MIACAPGWPEVQKKRRIRLTPASGSTRSVFFGRGFLWLMILFIVGLIFYIAIGNSTSDSTRLVFSQIKQMSDLQNVMKKPFYHGLDKDNMPFSITADQAIQQDADTVLMQNLKADMETKGGKWVALQANSGEFKSSTKVLTLTRDVDMFYDGGFEFRSDYAVIDVANGTASGNMPITGQGPMGTLQADKFAVYNRGDVIRFEGNVRTRIYR